MNACVTNDQQRMTNDQPVLVSACLLGFACRHDAADRRNPAVLKLLAHRSIVPICPEMAGGLSAPRQAATLDHAGVVNGEGSRVTAAFEMGAALAVEAAQRFGCRTALLKQNSPSCGTRQTNRDWQRVAGQGVAATALLHAGVRAFGEDEIA